MRRLLPLALLFGGAAPALAQSTPPKLIVTISVDQFSADLFDAYRPTYTGGLARLAGGAVFHNGFQSHAATETCPGHSTIMTGFRPAHTGIIANQWVDQRVGRADTTVYCMEDESVPGMTHEAYVVSDKHLRVPTLGERMKAADPRVRTVSVAGKDRAAVTMGGHRIDELWYWDPRGSGAFVSYAGRATPPVVARTNAAVAAQLAVAAPALEAPANCAAKDHVTTLQDGSTVGTGHYARAAGDKTAFRASPAFDAAILALAAGMVQDMKLGQGPATDVLTVGLSATDYIGHTYGPGGAEMCIQMANLDRSLGSFLAVLDATGVDYEVVLTADHGGNDVPEREVTEGIPNAARVDKALAPAVLGKELAERMKLTGPLLFGDIPNGDVWVSTALPPAQKRAVTAAAIAAYRAFPQVDAVLPRAEIAASPMPSGDPTNWTLLQKARASFDAERSGDFLVFLKPRITPIPLPSSYVATHGSPWNYDRRVPILFWRKGMTPFEHQGAIETVDIAPTLAKTVGFAMPKVDGRCLDLTKGGAPCR